jgi:hypothetical protein
MQLRTTMTAVMAAVLVSVWAVEARAQAAPKAPKGFTVAFNGKDLSGWRGRPGGGGVFSPYVEAKFTPEERTSRQAEWNADRDAHWSVDAKTGELVSDGHGVHLATEKTYGDFEFLVDWKLTQPGGESGIRTAAAPRRTAPTRARAGCGTTTPTTRAVGRSRSPTSRSASGTPWRSGWLARVCG